MNRRSILRSLLIATGATTPGFRLTRAGGSAHRGKFLVSVQADGGWDPTSFCDPKVNQKGEKTINHWAEGLDVDDLPEAGNIRYAPWAKNEEFFDKHYDKTLVINGVDAQTNSHTAGVVHNWSGRISEGNPTTTAVYAGEHGSGMSMGYLSFGGFSQTAGLTRFTRLDSPHLLRNLAAPESNVRGGRYFNEYDWERIESLRSVRAARLAAQDHLMPRARRNRQWFQSALGSVGGLSDYVAALPSDYQLEADRLRRQAQLAIVGFRTGAAVSADLLVGNFDTHDNHDEKHEPLLSELTDGVGYLWDYAEQHGVADRMVVVIGSDFGRTNFYNSQDGKDHWPIGSFVIMEKNQPWTNRVVGETDDLHFAHRINPTTLERDDTIGTIIYPKHVHKALRRYLGIENTPGAQRFPFNNTEDFAFFG